MKKIAWLFMTFWACSPFALAQTAPSVVVTIPPIHALVTEVMTTVAEPVLLLEGGVSPHTYQLRPSQVRQLQHADLVVWVGPQLEGFLQKTLQGLPESVQRMSLLTLPHLNMLAVRRGGVWEADAHHESGTTETHHHHAHDEDEDQHTDKAASHSIDPHIWLDPENAQVIIQAIAAQLSQLDPDNAAIYQANAERATADISALDQALKTQLAPIQAQPFIVFHDAYHYFEQHYQLNAVGAISLSPEQQPSAQRLEEIRYRIKTAHVRCVFREPQFQPSLVTVVLENTPAQQGVLDPLGITLTETGAALYRALLQHLADNLVACLQ